MFFQEVDDAARLGDFQNKIRQRTGVIAMPVCAVENFAAGQIDFDLLPLGDVSRGFGAFKDGQADVDGIAEKDAREGCRDDAVYLRAFDGDRRVLARRTTAEVLPANDHIPRLDVPGILRLDLAKDIPGKLERIDGDVVPAGNDLVRVEVLSKCPGFAHFSTP